MFEMGFWEIVLIFVIMLLVVGPERLPKVARTIGLWVGKARTMVNSVRSEIEQELRVEELKQSLHKEANTEEFKKLAQEFDSIKSDVSSMGKDVERSVNEDTRKIADDLSKPKSTSPQLSTSRDKKSEPGVSNTTVTNTASDSQAPSDSKPNSSPVQQTSDTTAES